MSAAGSLRILIVEARFYEDIADALFAGARAELEAHGARFDRITVPGAFEIPAVIAMAERAATAGRGPRYDGYIALGCVIRGETTHYDYVAGESARGLMDLAVREGLAIGYGILTTENRDQAWVRADPAQKNKGADAARACLQQIANRRRLEAWA